MVRSVAISLCFGAFAGAFAVDQNPGGDAFTNSLSMKFVRIAGGKFVMGQGDGAPKSREEWNDRDWDEAPAHKVTISQPFFMGVHEVTNAQFEQFDPEHKKWRGVAGGSKADDEPVGFVTWQQAVDFCNWLSKKEGKPYRLPTEAEWEYACRAGTTTLFNAGDQLKLDQANFGGAKKGGVAVRVGTYKPNAWGLYDMHGNVAEWCFDWYGPYEAGAQTDPIGRADGYARVVRGWSFLGATHPSGVVRYCRSANRSGLMPQDANKATGFRVVLVKMPATKPLPAVVLPWQKDVKQSPAPKGGPDPKKPYFVNFKEAGKNATIPKDTWGPIFSQHNHFTAVCVCPNGDVLAVWYTCVQEAGRECSQAVSRLRAASDTFEPASLFFTVPDVNAHAPVLLCDGKRIWHFFTQSLAGWDNANDCVRFSDDSGATWSRPQIMVARHDPLPLSQPCTALIAKDGSIVVACDGDVHKDERVIISKDYGKTWKVGQGDMRKAAGGKYVIHPAIFQKADGELMSYLRGPHPMLVAVSKDLGDSWEVRDTPFPGISGGMKPVALKLASGAVVLCSIDTKNQLVGGGTFAALSLDDGKTWPHVRKVEGADGYMSLAQAPNGVIYLSGSRMGCAAFNEAWLKEGKAVPGGN